MASDATAYFKSLFKGIRVPIEDDPDLKEAFENSTQMNQFKTSLQEFLANRLSPERGTFMTGDPLSVTVVGGQENLCLYRSILVSLEGFGNSGTFLNHEVYDELGLRKKIYDYAQYQSPQNDDATIAFRTYLTNKVNGTPQRKQDQYEEQARRVLPYVDPVFVGGNRGMHMPDDFALSTCYLPGYIPDFFDESLRQEALRILQQESIEFGQFREAALCAYALNIQIAVVSACNGAKYSQIPEEFTCRLLRIGVVGPVGRPVQAAIIHNGGEHFDAIVPRRSRAIVADPTAASLGITPEEYEAAKGAEQRYFKTQGVRMWTAEEAEAYINNWLQD